MMTEQNQEEVTEAMAQEALIEALAEYAHNAWSGWMNYLFSKGVYLTMNDQEGTPKRFWLMNPWAVERWNRQAATPYEDLSEEEKESDRDEARAILEILASFKSGGQSD